MSSDGEGAEAFDALDRAEKGIRGDDSEPEEAPRRRRNREKDTRKDLLKAMREGNREAALQQDDDLLYEEVDETQYKEIVRKRRDDDFIVDDGTADYNEYADHGGELWDEDDDFYGESDAAQKAKRRKGGFGDRAKTQKKAKARVSSLFTGGGKANKLGAIKGGEDNGEDSFLKELLAEEGADMQEDAPAPEVKHKQKKTKNWGFQQLVLQGKIDEEDPEAAARPTPARTAARADPYAHLAERRADDDVDFEPAPRPASKAAPAPAAKATAKPAAASHPAPKASSAAAPAAPAPAAPKSSVKVVSVGDDEEEAEEDPARSSYLVCSKPEVKTDDWQKVRDQEAQPQSQEPEIQVDSSKLPLQTDEDGESFLRLYWLDAYEGEGGAAGTIFLFGKVWVDSAKAFVSCCVSVKNNERNLFVLPRECKLDARNEPTSEKVEIQDVYEELTELLTAKGVSTFRCKPVTRKYAFEISDVPAEAQYLKIKYNADLGRLQDGDFSGKTFSHVFGTNIGPLERFLMKRDLMGPCWLDIKGVKPSKQAYTWCKLECETDDPKNVTRVDDGPAAPPLVVLSISMLTILNQKTNSNEILMLSGVVHNNVQIDGPTDRQTQITHFTAIRKLGENPIPPDFKTRLLQVKNKAAEIHPNERALLGQFMARLAKIDPDVLLGHNLLGFDLDVLLHRIKANSIPHWSRLGRLRRQNMPKLQAGPGGRANYAERTVACGRLLCDVKISAREFIRIVNYDMTELVQTQLNVARTDVDPEAIPRMYTQSDTLLKLTEHVERDAYLILQLMFKLDVVPLSKQITSVTGGLLCRTFAGGRAERNEYLLCHEFHRNKFVVPDKMAWKANNPAPVEAVEGDDGDAAPASSKSAKGRRKPAYAGGLVLEPKKGFYDKYILLLDFNSLYPSIIQEYNICFTTVKRHDLPEGTPADLPDPTLERGILPRVLKTLIKKRKAVKELIKTEKSPEKLAEYDIRQKALKLTANSMYGCLGFSGSRFFARPLAEMITSKGREILQKTVDLAREKLNLDVIYGDTDSVMINTRCTSLPEVKKIGNEMRKEVNSLYRELEIDIDGVFKTMLLLKKKKYAALAIKEKGGEVTAVQETKGLDMVRRDWCVLSHDVGYYILNQILSRESREDLVEACHEYLREVARDINTPGKIPIEKFIIHKGLTKNPEDYPDKQNQPHVQVALRLKQSGKSVRALDTIPYVIALDGTTNPASQRAYHPDDMRKNVELKIDIQYYLTNQIHPVVSRLIEPIEGTDNAQIAECLGLDAASYRRDYADDVADDVPLSSQISDAERFQACDRLMLKCRLCSSISEFPGPIRGQGDARRCSLLCTSPTCTGQYSVAYLCNTLTMTMRAHIDKYYLGALTCDDTACPLNSKETRVQGIVGRKCPTDNCVGNLHRRYTDKQLYTQLSYYLHLFNAKGHPEAQLLLAGHMGTFEAVYKHINRTLTKNDWNIVDFGMIFHAIETHRAMSAPVKVVTLDEEDLAG
eukprot:m.49542 g.49542  ORF g.49542 m.49542 type:complete len:1491 (+) comp6134_c0_seq1:22-4494(+)